MFKHESDKLKIFWVVIRLNKIQSRVAVNGRSFASKANSSQKLSFVILENMSAKNWSL